MKILINSKIKGPPKPWCYGVSIGIACWLLVSTVGLYLYSGDKIIFAMFSFAFGLMVLTAIKLRIGPSYLVFSFLIFLGFWVKLMVHIILNYEYIEPTGLFNYESHYDEVLMVSAIGALSIILAGYTFNFLPKSAIFFSGERIPVLYGAYKSTIWVLFFLGCFSLFFYNHALGLYQLGVTPLGLPWPITGIIGWAYAFGIPLFTYTLVFWHLESGGKIFTCILIVFIIALLSSISGLSRATFLFHTLPFLVSLVVVYGSEIIKNKCLIRVGFFWVFMFFTSLYLVQSFRYHKEFVLISPVVSSSVSIKREVLSDSQFSQIGALATFPFDEYVQSISRLAFDRWIGLEGVMAVVAHQEKSFALFLDVISERRTSNRLDYFTEKIANVDSSKIDLATAQYASIPGPIAFFFYPGNYWFLFLGMFIFSIALPFLDALILKLTSNPYFYWYWGFFLAQSWASFGTGVTQTATFFMACFTALFFVSVVQSGKGV